MKLPNISELLGTVLPVRDHLGDLPGFDPSLSYHEHKPGEPDRQHSYALYYVKKSHTFNPFATGNADAIRELLVSQLGELATDPSPGQPCRAGVGHAERRRWPASHPAPAGNAAADHPANTGTAASEHLGNCAEPGHSRIEPQRLRA